MIAPLVYAAALTPPDLAPLHGALERCDRAAIAAVTAGEPRRRADFAGAVYAEQRAIADERAKLDGAVPAPASVVTVPGGSLDQARQALDLRQRRLDDARGVERAWRETVEETRAAFLAQCTIRREGERQP